MDTNKKKYIHQNIALKSVKEIARDLGLSERKVRRFLQKTGLDESAHRLGESVPVHLVPKFSYHHKLLLLSIITLSIIFVLFFIHRANIDEPYNYNVTGLSYIDKGEIDKAIIEFEKGIKKFPAYPDLHHSLAQAYFYKGRYQDAEHTLNQVLEIKPDFPEAISTLGSVYYKTGEFEKSREAYQKAVNLRPNSPDFHFNLGNSYIRTGKKAEGVQEWQKALQLDPTYKRAKDKLLEYEKAGIETSNPAVQKQQAPTELTSSKSSPDDQASKSAGENQALKQGPPIKISEVILNGVDLEDISKGAPLDLSGGQLSITGKLENSSVVSYLEISWDSGVKWKRIEAAPQWSYRFDLVLNTEYDLKFRAVNKDGTLSNIETSKVRFHYVKM